MNKTTTTVRLRADRTLERKTETGWEPIGIPKSRPNPNVDEPAYDPDNMPRTDADFARMKRVPRTKSMRRALALNQEEFADRYDIPIETLRDWEEGRAEPDAVARAYLFLIGSDPKGTAEKLQKRKEWRAKSATTARHREEAH